MKNSQRGIKQKIGLFLLSWMLVMHAPSGITWADTIKDYHAVLTETAAFLQQQDSDPGLNSSWNIIGLVRCNATVPQNYYNTFYQNVLKGLSDCNGQLTTTRYTEYSKLILSVTAIGKDAQNVGGYNLLSYLSNYDHVSKQGINGTIWALIAVNSKSTYDFPKEKGVAVQTTRKLLVDKLLAAELKTGGFALYGNDADVDVTAMAIQALAPYYSSRQDVKSAVDRATQILSSKQNSTGDYKSGEISNAESTAQVLTALSALSIDAATDSRYEKGSISLLKGLLSYYMGNGSFCHVSGGTASALATEQSFYALAAYDCFQKGGKLYDMEDIPNNPAIDDTENSEKQPEKQPEKETEKDTEKETEKVTQEPTTPNPSTLTTTPDTQQSEGNGESNYVEPVLTGTDATALSVQTVNSAPKSSAPKAGTTSSFMVIYGNVFTGLQGKDSNYEINGKTADGTEYGWTFHGTDIKTPIDFDGTVVLGGDYVSQINQLANAPFIFVVGQQDFPGEALFTITTGLADGSYGLFSYDATSQSAKLLQKIEVKDKQTRCILAKGGNYYIAQKSKASLVTEQEAVTGTLAVSSSATKVDSIPTIKAIHSSDKESKLIIVKAIFFTMSLALLTGLFAIGVNRIPETPDKEVKKDEDEQSESKKL